MIANSNGKTTTRGLAYGYDLGDTTNSYKGMAKTNLLSQYGRTYGEQNTSLFKTHYYSRTLQVPTIGTRTVESIDTYNNYNGGSGVCCQQAWSLGSSAVIGNTTYTYSIIYRSKSGYTHPNFMYKYEYGASGYINEAGLHNDGNRASLGDGWYHAWGIWTTHPNTTSMNFYFYMYEYGVYNTIDIAGIMVTKGAEITPPKQFLPVATARNNENSLISLVPNSSPANVGQMSYTYNGGMFFDGINDNLSVSNSISKLNGPAELTCEFVFEFNRNGYFGTCWLLCKGNVNTEFDIILSAEEGETPYLVWRTYPSVQPDFDLYWNFIDNNAFVDQGYNHMTLTFNKDTGTKKIYCNNHLVTEQAGLSGGIVPNNGPITIGSYKQNSYYGQYFPGNIPVLKLYNKELTATEINRNWQNYQPRFGLTSPLTFEQY